MVIKERKYTLLDVLILPMQAAPVYTVLIILNSVLSGLITSINIIVTASFINAVISAVTDKISLSSVILPLSGVLLLAGWKIISPGLIKFVNIKFTNALNEKFRTAISEKISRLTYNHIENQNSADLILRVSEKPEEILQSALFDLLSLVSVVISIGGVLLILLNYIWWAALIAIVIMIPLFRLAMLSGKQGYAATMEVSKMERKINYLTEVLTGREGIEERTLFGYTGYVNQKYSKQFDEIFNLVYKTRKKWWIRMRLSGIATALFSFAIFFIMIKPTVTGQITVGLFISLVTSIFNLIWTMSWQFTNNIQNISRSREFIKDLAAFATLSEEEAEALPINPPIQFSSIEFKDVKFKYPGTENYILKGLSLTIKHGKHYAFVGVNGAGKTTVTKLLTGLYLEYEGEILIDGKELKKFSQSELKSLYSAVFQDFARYSVSLKDNIALGKINGATDEEIYNAASLAGLDQTVKGLPAGFDTYLGKIKKDGVDISGGQWQRVAMARAIINPAAVKILDEPTAALDPISESRIYESFEKISKGSTTIFISHRLGSTKLADVIFVIDDGRVAEEGSHKELMEKNNIYAQMFESQRSWYI